MRSIYGLIFLVGLAGFIACSGKTSSERGTSSNDPSESGTSGDDANVDVFKGSIPGSVTGRNLLDVVVVMSCGTPACVDVTMRGQLRYSDKTTADITASNARKLGVTSIDFTIVTSANGRRADLDTFTPQLFSTDGKGLSVKASARVAFANGTSKETKVSQLEPPAEGISNKLLYMFFSSDLVTGDLTGSATSANFGVDRGDYLCGQTSSLVAGYAPFDVSLRFVWFAALVDLSGSISSRLAPLGVEGVFFNDHGNDHGSFGSDVGVLRPIRVISSTSGGAVDRQIAPAGTKLHSVFRSLKASDAISTGLMPINSASLNFWWLDGCNQWMSDGLVQGDALELVFGNSGGMQQLLPHSLTCNSQQRIVCFAAEK